MKKLIVCSLLAVAFLSAAMVHEMAWAENKCAELGNTPQQCAILGNEVL